MRDDEPMGDPEDLLTVARGEPVVIQDPVRIGRYDVRSRIGIGGAGVVYEAHDPELDRIVAIKLLVSATRGSAADRSRLLREAQALARISAPHVVPVYDVGVAADTGAVYLVMERVRGEDLRHWIRGKPRLRELVAAFVAAGRGLVSAHAAGVLHRDFKPANVFVGEDGRVCVGDFGLARPLAAVDREPESRLTAVAHRLTDSGVSHVSTSGGLLSDVVTEGGVVMGTPMFMAPEQHDGVMGSTVDQYAFCVSMYWALFGRYPFEAKTNTELLAKKRAGVLPDLRLPPGVPRALLDALARGLARDPTARHPDMAALVEAIERAFSRARTRRVLTGLAVLGGIAATAMVVGPSRVAHCPPGTDRVAEVWNAATRVRAAEAITAAGTGYARDAWHSVERRLDAYANSWVGAYDDACTAERNDDMEFDAAMRCLDRRLDAFAGVLDVLQVPGAELGLRAVEVADALPVLVDCAGTPDDELGALPIDERLRERFVTERGKLDRVRALVEANQLDEAETIARDVERTAVELGLRPLEALAVLELAELAGKRGDPQASVEGLERGALLADAVGLDRLAAEAKANLAFRLAHELHRPDDAERWLAHAEATNARAGGEAIDAVQMLDLRATIHLVRGEYEAARDLLVRSVELAGDHPRRAAQYGHLGVVENILGDHVSAAAHHRRARELSTERYGPDHPLVAYELGNEGLALAAAGRHAEAETAFARELDVLERAFGPEHREVATALSHLVSIYEDRGEHERALVLAERVLELTAKSYGPRHPSYARALYSRATVLGSLVRHGEAIVDLERAVGIVEDAVGHEHADLVHPLGALARALTAAGRPEEAIAPLRRALAVFDRSPQDPGVRADLRFALSRALWQSGARVEARREAEGAREDQRRNGSPADAAEIERWLAKPD